MGLPLETSIGRLTGYPLHCQTDKPLYREIPDVFRVCPFCLVEPEIHQFFTGEFINETHHCVQHGSINPIRSAVRNIAHIQPILPICWHCDQPVDRHFVGCKRPRRAEKKIDWSAA